jgi:hypothetical protein
MDRSPLTALQIWQVEQDQQDRRTRVTLAEIDVQKAYKQYNSTIRLSTDDRAQKSAALAAARLRLEALLVPGPDECRLPQKSTVVVRFAPEPLSLRHTVCFKRGQGGKKRKDGKASK